MADNKSERVSVQLDRDTARRLETLFREGLVGIAALADA
jgi:hypothetical protein